MARFLQWIYLLKVAKPSKPAWPTGDPVFRQVSLWEHYIFMPQHGWHCADRRGQHESWLHVLVCSLTGLGMLVKQTHSGLPLRGLGYVFSTREMITWVSYGRDALALPGLMTDTSFWHFAGISSPHYRNWMLGFTAAWCGTGWALSCKEDLKFKWHVRVQRERRPWATGRVAAVWGGTFWCGNWYLSLVPLK